MSLASAAESERKMTKPVEIWISPEGRDLLNRLAAAEGRTQRQTLERIIKFAWNRCRLRDEAVKIGVDAAIEKVVEENARPAVPTWTPEPDAAHEAKMRAVKDVLSKTSPRL